MACAPWQFFPPCLKLNNTLTYLDMNSNEIGDLGANGMADALKHGCGARLLVPELCPVFIV